MIVGFLTTLFLHIACRLSGNHTWVGKPDVLGSVKIRCKYCGRAMWAVAVLLCATDAQAFTKNFSIQLTTGNLVTVMMTEDAYQGDAQYSIMVDGAQTATGTVTAPHNTPPQTATISVSDGPHSVVVTFLNDNYGGSPQADRNLYVVDIVYNGVLVPGSSAALLRTGDALTVAVPPPAAPTPVAITLPTSAIVSDQASAGQVVATVTVTMSDGSTNFAGTLGCGTPGSAVCAAAPFVSVSGTDLVLNRALTTSDQGTYTATVSTQ